jgi:hypothetical protein
LRRAVINLRAVGVVASLLTAGCAASASPESGVTALLRVSNGQFVEGALTPDTSATGSAVISGVAINNTNVYPGEQNFPLSGTVTGATALIGLEDDVGYWIVPATLIDQTTVGGYDFSTQLTFSPLMPVGSQTLILRGVTKDGTVGPAQLYKLDAATIVPSGALVITLAWDTEVDLDLHVVMPNVADPTTPIEIWAKHPVGLPVPVLGGPPIYPDQIANAPYLDFDSNANCVIDGRRQENVIFPVAPSPGSYTVRVDTPSLCGLSNAQWTVSATLADGTVLGTAQWESTDSSTRGPHVAGSGLLAFTFTISTPTQ